MIDLEKLKEVIQHDKSDEHCLEQQSQRPLYAYRVDGTEGLREVLGFKESETSQSDFCLFDTEKNKAQIIELTNLSNDIQNCIVSESLLSNEQVSFAEVLQKSPKKAQKIVQGKIWSEIFAEFKNKWMGSIAIIERYCRRESYQDDFKYSMLLILTNDMNPLELRSLELRLAGMMGKVQICRTRDAENLLLKKLY